MRVPISWLRDIVGKNSLPDEMTAEQVAAALVRVGLEEEAILGGEISGPLVVGRVLTRVEEPQKNGKVINWCTVDVGENGQRLSEQKDQEIVCGAHNFDVGDLVVVVLPGAVLPGGFEISARKTYGHMSNGMICAEDELGLGEDHEGIIVLTEYFKNNPDKLARCVPGADAIELLGLDEKVVEINVTPDRGYAFSMRGVARDFALSVGAPVVDPAVDAASRAPEGNESGYEVRLEDENPIRGNDGCDRYVARVVRGVNPDTPTPEWMVQRLVQSGMRPISFVVDVTNYVMLLLGNPLHAFDLSQLEGPIVVRRARPDEKLTTLDGVERELDGEDLVITDSGEKPLVLAGVMGGMGVEVTDKTTDVLIEAACFDPVSVARSSRRHRLSSESSKRFERGVDPALAPAAAEMVADLLVRYAGGTADEGVTDVGERAALARITTPFTMSMHEPERLVGLKWTPAQIGEELSRLGVSATGNGDGTLSIVAPSWRPDLRTGADVVEELARLRGYEQIGSVLPAAPGGRGLTVAQRVVRRVSDTLANAGFVEVLTYPFVASERFDELQYGEEDERRVARRLVNPLRAEQPLLRTTVLSTLVDAAARNVARGIRDVAVFEVGRVVHGVEEPVAAPVPAVGAKPEAEVLAQIDQALPQQPHHVAFVAAGVAVSAAPGVEARAFDAADVIGAVLEVGRALGLNLVVEAAECAPWHPGRCAKVSTEFGECVGYAGELAPRVCKAVDLPAHTCAAELNVDVLIDAFAACRAQAVKLSTLPVANTDVALVVDEVVSAAEVESALREGAGPLLEELTLFDVFRGEQVGEGKKSLAYRLTFRPREKTLKTTQVSALRDDAVAAAKKATGAELRG
ncbi:phenylalanine--tRNA ligase subunit beta [Dermatophilus congolensis]|uniref:phenylalanine--tRNA ligase subunit beta n=1 Tax=Dermatophilus congolensis TaxID=1863 RepID=UPI001AAFDF75|nr:phenylalanine--tRNA ligase subunit beta [Dermatophilus congolensis]MBO3142370.1 phenylalanine--tRNA ligase subunit beta [Dermatophilus congolensis]MBO3151361.1 phenylalanine--tRNA ligase subunit beta [Dermatophilus congolensis]MBO3161635.1 phenylalanine--tRNA ligase subunit beta [Dermatophilus congolensis]MBO3162647.1 phenylalanine--tRNA ligase subunit beta [Dermatophilus congolensis]MBO3176200.1 phenylalanine--tRNA ligase subunit beta [Dermatophilus congolensis]